MSTRRRVSAVTFLSQHVSWTTRSQVSAVASSMYAGRSLPHDIFRAFSQTLSKVAIHIQLGQRGIKCLLAQWAAQ